MKESEFEKLEEALASKHYHLKKEWLKTCVEYIETNIQKSMSFQTILNQVVHQFLNSDISKSYEPQMKLPAAAAKMMISKKMIFQIISHINISNSIYEQLGEATKDRHDLSWFHGNQNVIDEQETEQYEADHSKKNKKRGLIKLELFDGVNKVWAIEYAEEVFTEDQMIPGAKILLVNKVKCRKGLLFLDRSNCQYLGGRVQELEYNIVKKFAEILKIDLDAEKNRRKLAREKAEEIRRMKRDKQHKTQSTISPFLVKKNRPENEKKKNTEIPAPSTSSVNRKAITDILNDSFDDIQVEDLEPSQKKNTKIFTEPRLFEVPLAKKTSPVRQVEENYSSFEHEVRPQSNDRIFSNSLEKQKNEEFERAKLNNSIDEWSYVVEDSQPAQVLQKSPELQKVHPKPRQESSFSKVNLSSDVVGKTCTFTEERRKSTPVEDINVFQPKVKQLPKRLLEDPSPVHTPPQLSSRIPHRLSNQNRTETSSGTVEKDVEIYQPGKIRNLLPNESISWKLKQIKNEMEEPKDDNISDIMPPGFIQKETLRSSSKNAQKIKDGQRKLIEKLTRDIHGPRNFKKPESKKTTDETRSDSLITSFFNTVKNLNKNKSEKQGVEKNEKLIQMGIVTPVQQPKKPDFNENYVEKEVERESDESDENSDEEFEKMLQQVRSAHKTDRANVHQEPKVVDHRPSSVVPYSPPTRRVPSPQIPDTQNSVLNCTLESDGRRECERWHIGIDGQRQDQQLKRRIDEEDECVVDDWNPSYMAYKMSKMENEKRRMESRTARISDPGFHSGQRLSHRKQNSHESHHNRPGPSNIPYNNSLIAEIPTMSRTNSISGMMGYSSSKEVAVIRQSMNVQHYKTPLSKRIPSSENPKKFAEELITRFSNLNIIPLKDALANRKYWMMSKIVVVMPTCCQQLHELQSDGIDWQLKMKLSDTSISDIICLVSTDLLDRIFGFSVNHCKKLFDQSKVDELRMKKMEAEKKLHGFKRLDLVIWIEVSPQFEKMPIIVDVKTLSDAINIL